MFIMKNKQITSIYLSVIILLSLICTTATATDKNIYVDAKSAIAIDSKSRCVLFEKNSEMIVPIASTTKILTTLVAISYGDLDRKVEISSRAANIHGSQVGYKQGELVTIRELLYGLMMKSGNDAAIAIAEGISGNVDEFLKLMNDYAIQIGTINSHFESPHGLDSQNHYSTAYDLALITAVAKENETFNKIVSAKDIDAAEYNFTRSYHNINKILYQIPGANGVKTGYTGNAGKCLVSSVENKESEIIIVVLNCTKRWTETKKIYDYVTKKYDFKRIISKEEIVKSIPYENDKTLDLICDEDITIPLGKDETYETKIIYPKILPRHIYKGSSLGKVCIYKDEKLIISKALKSNNDVKIKSTPIRELIKRFLK